MPFRSSRPYSRWQWYRLPWRLRLSLVGGGVRSIVHFPGADAPSNFDGSLFPQDRPASPDISPPPRRRGTGSLGVWRVASSWPRLNQVGSPRGPDPRPQKALDSKRCKKWEFRAAQTTNVSSEPSTIFCVPPRAITSGRARLDWAIIVGGVALGSASSIATEDHSRWTNAFPCLGWNRRSRKRPCCSSKVDWMTRDGSIEVFCRRARIISMSCTIWG